MNSENLQNEQSDTGMASQVHTEVAHQSAFSFSHSPTGNWQRHVARPRIDLSNIEELQNWAREMRARGETWLVIDLKGTRFMSLPVIRFLENLSHELREAGGALALLSMPDKTHRIFEIYGSLKNIFLIEKIENLKSVRAYMTNPMFRAQIRYAEPL